MPLRISDITLDSMPSDPPSPEEGEFWYNSTEDRFKVYRNGSIESLSDLDELTAHLADYNNPHGVSLEKARQVYSTVSGTIDMGSNKILNVGDPTLDGDAVNKLYSDSYVNGILVSGTPSDGQHFSYHAGNGVWQFLPAPSISGASNVGVGGVGVFDGLSNGVLQFKNINTTDSFVTITDDVGNNEIDIHVDNTSAVWNANKIDGMTVSSGAGGLNHPLHFDVLTYNSSTKTWYPDITPIYYLYQTTIKAGTIYPGSFTGTPPTATYTSVGGFLDTNYGVAATACTVSGTVYACIVQNKTTDGFEIVMGSNDLSDLVSVGWVAAADGEGSEW